MVVTTRPHPIAPVVVEADVAALVVVDLWERGVDPVGKRALPPLPLPHLPLLDPLDLQVGLGLGQVQRRSACLSTMVAVVGAVGQEGKVQLRQ